MQDVLISWSGGKDSCLAVYGLEQAGTHCATAEAFKEYRARGIEEVVLGDLFVEDVRAYRERFLVWKCLVASLLGELSQ